MSYPMVRGTALIPRRFWDYVTVFDDIQYKDLVEKGFIISNYN